MNRNNSYHPHHLRLGGDGVTNVEAETETDADANADAHRQLSVLHDFMAALQSAADIEEVQERVLEAVTNNLGFKRTVIGLVDAEKQVITGWLGRVRKGETLSTIGLPYPIELPLTEAGGLVARALLEKRICRATSGPCTSDGWINQYFGMQGCLILPMFSSIQPVGVLLVDISENKEIQAAVSPCQASPFESVKKAANGHIHVANHTNTPSTSLECVVSPTNNQEANSRSIINQANQIKSGPSRLRSLQAITQQTAIILGIMSTRLRRAQERAIQEERARIAQDMHDTVAQSLFGIVYTLNGCLKLLPSNPTAIQPELKWALQVAEKVRKNIRHTIHDMWPESINAERFETDLRNYAADTLHATNLSIEFDIRGDFAILCPFAKRSIYRICQEALTNTVHHAAATEARICLDIAKEQAQLVVRDNGRGFEPAIALAQLYNREHFGLRGIQQRVQSLRGTCNIFSQPGEGTSIMIDIPLKA